MIWRKVENGSGRGREAKQMKAKALKVVRRLMQRAFVEGFERWREQATP